MSRKMTKLIWHILTYLIVISQLAIPAYQARAAYLATHPSDDSFEFVTQEMVDANLSALAAITPQIIEPEGEVSVWDLLPQSDEVSELEQQNVELLPPAVPVPESMLLPQNSSEIVYASSVYRTSGSVTAPGNVLAGTDGFATVSNSEPKSDWDCIVVSFGGSIENVTTIRWSAAYDIEAKYEYYLDVSEQPLECFDQSNISYRTVHDTGESVGPNPDITGFYTHFGELPIPSTYAVRYLRFRSTCAWAGAAYCAEDVGSVFLESISIEGNYTSDFLGALGLQVGSPPTGDQWDYSAVDSDSIKQSLVFDGNVLPSTGDYFYGVNDVAMQGDDTPLILHRSYSTEYHRRFGAFDFGFGWDHNFSTGLIWFDEERLAFLDPTGAEHYITYDRETNEYRFANGFLANFVGISPDLPYEYFTPTYNGYRPAGIKYCLELSDHTVYYFDESGYVRLIGNTRNEGSLEDYDPCGEDNNLYRGLLFQYRSLSGFLHNMDYEFEVPSYEIQVPSWYPDNFQFKLLERVTAGVGSFSNYIEFSYRDTPLIDFSMMTAGAYFYYRDSIVIETITSSQGYNTTGSQTTCFTYQPSETYNMAQFVGSGTVSISDIPCDSINSSDYITVNAGALQMLSTATDVRNQTWRYVYALSSQSVTGFLIIPDGASQEPHDYYQFTRSLSGIINPAGEITEYIEYYCQETPWFTQDLTDVDNDGIVEVPCTDDDTDLFLQSVFRHWNGTQQLLGSYEYTVDDSDSNFRIITTEVIDEEGAATEYIRTTCSPSRSDFAACSWLNHTGVDNTQISFEGHHLQYGRGSQNAIRLQERVDINGNETTFFWNTERDEFNDLYTLDTIGLPNETTIEYTYDDYGNQTSIINPLEHETSFEFNSTFVNMIDSIDYDVTTTSNDIQISPDYSNGQPHYVDTDVSETITSYHPEFGFPECVFIEYDTLHSSSRNITYRYYEYDDLGRVINIFEGSNACYGNRNNPENMAQHFEYDIAGNVTLSVQNYSQYLHQLFGTIVCDLDNYNICTQLEYDDDTGRLENIIDPQGRIVNYIYDAAGRVISVETPNPDNVASPLTTTYSYNSQDSAIRVTDPYGRTNWTCYDGLQRPTLQLTNVDMQGQIDVEATYQDVCNSETPLPLTQTDIHNLTTIIAYDNGDTQSGIEIITVIDPSGVVTKTYNDHMGREIAVVYNWVDGNGSTGGEHDFARPDENIIVWTRYDAVGNVVEVIDLHYSPTEPLNYDGQNYSSDQEINLGDETNPSPSNDFTRSTRYCYNERNQMTRQVINWDRAGSPCADGYQPTHHNGERNDQNLVTEYTYDAVGNMTVVVQNPNQPPEDDDPQTTTTRRETHYVYDGIGRVERVIQNYEDGTFELNNSDLDLITEYHYDHRGNLEREIEWRGTESRCTTYEYDNLGRQRFVTYNDSDCTTDNRIEDESDLDIRYETQYDAAGRVTSQIDPYNLTTIFEYDDLDRVISVRDPRGLITDTTYQPNPPSNPEHLWQITTSSADISQLSYLDHLDRQVLSTSPQGRVMEYTYDIRGQVLSATDPSGRITRYGYDALGQLTCMIENAAESDNTVTCTTTQGVRTIYAYDSSGNLIKVTLPNGGVIDYIYDALGRRIYTDGPLPDSGTTFDVSRVEYDLLGRPIEITDPNQLVNSADYTQRITYNALNQTESITYSDGLTEGFDYNNFNLLHTMTNNSTGTTTYDYDLMHRVVNVDDPLNQSVSYEYDQLGRRTQVSFPGAGEISQPVAYDYSRYKEGFVTVRDWNTGETEYEFDSLNQLTNVTLPNGMLVEYTYTPDGQTQTIIYRQNGNVVAQYDYRYDDVGNRTVAYEQIAQSETPPGGYTAQEDYFQPRGDWIVIDDTNALYGTYLQTSVVDASLNFNVDPDYLNGITIIALRDVDAGSLDVCINDECGIAYDLSNSTREYGYEINVDPSQYNLTGNEETLNIRVGLESGDWLGIESIRILGPLPPGYYDDAPSLSGHNIIYSGNWDQSGGASARDNTVSSSNSSSDTVTFNVIPDDIDGLVIYHASAPGNGEFEVCAAGASFCPSVVATLPSGSAYIWGDRTYLSNQELDISGSVPVEITISPKAGTGSVSFDGVLILPAGGETANLPQITGTGVTTDHSVREVGEWLHNPDGAMWSGDNVGANPSASIMFGFDGSGLDISYWIDKSDNGLATHFEVCIDADCTVVSMQDFDALQSLNQRSGNHAYIYADNFGYHVAEIRNVSAKWIGIESITVLDERPILGTGLYDLNHPGLMLDGLWIDNDDPNYVQGTALRSEAADGTFETIEFFVDLTQMDSLVLWLDESVTSGTLFVNNSIFRNLTFPYFEISKSDLGLDNVAYTQARITIRFAGPYNEGPDLPGQIVLEAIQLIQEGPLSPGYYDQTPWGTGLNVDYDENWTLALEGSTGTDQPRDGSYTTTNVTDAEATFEIIPDDVEGITLYTLTYPGGGTFQLCPPNPLDCRSIDVGSINKEDGVPHYLDLELFNLSGTTPITFTIRNNIPNNWIVLEGIHIVAARAEESNLPLLTETTIIPNPDNVRQVSDWVYGENLTLEYGGVWWSGVSGASLGNPSSSMMFTFYGGGIEIIRHMNTAFADNIYEVCIDGDDCQIVGNFINANPGNDYGRRSAYVYADEVGYHTVEIRNAGSSETRTSWTGIEAITVLDTPQPVLGEGIYQVDDPGIVQDGEWVPYTNDSFYTTVDNHELRFLVDTSETDAIAIFASADSSTGNIDVCGIQLQPECVSLDPNLVNSGIVSIEPDWDSIGNPDTVEITLRYDKAGSSWLNIEAIQIVQYEPLQPGYYDVHPSDHNFNIQFEGEWGHESDSNARDNTIAWTDTGTAQFSVIPADVQAIILYARVNANHDVIRLCNVETPSYCDEYSTSGSLAYGVPFSIDLTAYGVDLWEGNLNTPVTLRLDAPTDGAYIVWEGIHIVATRPEESNLPLLTEETTVLWEDETIRRISDWSPAPPSVPTHEGYIAPAGSNPYDPTSSLMFTIYGTGIELEHYAYGSNTNRPFIEICLDGNTCRTFETESLNGDYGNTTVIFADEPGYHTVEIRNTSANWIGLEAIRVLTQPQPILEPGLYQETDDRLAVYGRWVTYNLPGMNGGNGIYTQSDEDEIRFLVDASQMEQLVVHYTGSTQSSLRICIEGDCTTESLTGTTYGSMLSYTPNWGSFGNPTVAEVILSNMPVSNSWLSIEAIEIREVENQPEQTAPEVAPLVFIIDEPVVDIVEPVVNEPLAPAMIPFYEPFDTNEDWTATTSDWAYQTESSYNGAGWTVDTTARPPFAMLEFDRAIDLTSATSPQLSWLQSADLSSMDIAAVDIRIEGETDWTIVYDETALDTIWQQQTIDLTPYIGNLIHIRFRLTTIGDVQAGETSAYFSVDDIRVEEASVVIIDAVTTTEPTATVTASPTITETVVVTEEPTTATVTPSATITDTPVVVTQEPTITVTPSATITETPAVTNTPSATITPTPTNPVTLQILVPVDGQVITHVEDTRFEAFANDTRAGLYNGANIDYVTFRIYDSSGQLVYERVEDIVRYCAGWGDATCNTLDFLLDQSGSYTLTAQATTNDGVQSDIVTRTFTVVSTSATATQPAVVTTTPIAIPTQTTAGLPFYEPFDNIDAWTSTTWTHSANGYVGASAFIDTSDRTQNNPAIVYTDSIDLSGANAPQLTWWQWADLSNSDTVQIHVQVEDENGWTRIYRERDLNTGWTQNTLDLSAYAGQSIRLRFRVRLNGNVANGQTSIGYAIDELWITDTANTVPTATAQAEFVIPAPVTQVTPTAPATMTPDITATPSATITPSETATPVQETRLDDNIRARMPVPIPTTTVELPPFQIPDIANHTISRQTVHYGYDELNHLTCANYYDALITLYNDCAEMDSNAQFNFVYQYDNMGNRTLEHILSPIEETYRVFQYHPYGQQLETVLSYGEIDNFVRPLESTTQLTYDHNGNLDQILNTSGGVVTDYTYNAANQMTMAQYYDHENLQIPTNLPTETTYTYSYDPMGNRYGQTANGVTTNYVLDTVGGLSQVLREHSSTGDTSYLHGLTSVGQYNGTWSYYGTDALGSVRNTFNNIGPSPHINSYDPYGNPILTGGLGNRGFTGEYTDPSGLQHLRARYYNPALGIFTQQDPVQGVVGGSSSMYWNPYGYVGGNPVNYTDPTGRFICDSNPVAAACDFFGGLASRIGQQVIAGGAGKTNNSVYQWQQDNPVLAIGLSIAFEPIDWLLLANSWSKGDRHALDLLGLLPFIPAGWRKGTDVLGFASGRGGRQAGDWVDDLIDFRRIDTPNGIDPELAVRAVRERLLARGYSEKLLTISSISVLRVNSRSYLGFSTRLDMNLRPLDGWVDDLSQALNKNDIARWMEQRTMHPEMTTFHAERAALNEFWLDSTNSGTVGRMFTNREVCRHCLRGTARGGGFNGEIIDMVGSMRLESVHMEMDIFLTRMSPNTPKSRFTDPHYNPRVEARRAEIQVHYDRRDRIRWSVVRNR